MKHLIAITILVTASLFATASMAGYPMISGIPNQKVSIGQSTGPISFRLSDDVTPPSDLAVSARSNNRSLVPNSNIDLGGSGANRTVEVTPVDGKWGLATIAVTVVDTDGERNQDTFNVEVVKTIRP
ncbi:MAG: hypothetical protein HN337_00800 [Deltaproteobacteria bacterium]|jgi:hypothetical protein|nr:hypothetical protein [Deltaproteobacteria bacterium]